MISENSTPRALQQALDASAERARLGGVNGDLTHYFIKYSNGFSGRGIRTPAGAPGTILDSTAMAGPVKTEAVVLRSMRYGEADRILHVYTPHRGRVSAIAKGVRRARSRFGGRLEPFFRLRMELHEGRGELLTVTGAQTVDGLPAPARRRPRAGRRRARVRRGRAAVRDLRAAPGVFNLLCRQPGACSTSGVAARRLGRAAARARWRSA